MLATLYLYILSVDHTISVNSQLPEPHYNCIFQSWLAPHNTCIFSDLTTLYVSVYSQCWPHCICIFSVLTRTILYLYILSVDPKLGQLPPLNLKFSLYNLKKNETMSENKWNKNKVLKTMRVCACYSADKDAIFLTKLKRKTNRCFCWSIFFFGKAFLRDWLVGQRMQKKSGDIAKHNNFCLTVSRQNRQGVCKMWKSYSYDKSFHMVWSNSTR